MNLLDYTYISVISKVNSWCVALLTGGELYDNAAGATDGLNPLGIATNANGGDSNIKVEGETSIVELLGLNDLYQLMKRDGLIIATIMVLVLLVSMLLVQRADKLAEKKADIMHKLGVVFIICSLIWILNVLVAIFDSVF